MIKRLKELHAQDANKIDIMLLHSRVLKNLNIIQLEGARKTRRIYAGFYEWSPEWRKGRQK